MNLEPALSQLGRRLILPGVAHFLARAGTDTVPGAVCSVAALGAAEALDAVCNDERPDASGTDQNPFTRRRIELSPTSLLRAMRPASVHYLIAIIEDRADRTLVASLLGLPLDEVVSRLFLVHADVFEVGRDSQHSIADYWSKIDDHARYSMGMWGLTTAAAFGVRHLQDDAALRFREHLDAQLPAFGHRLAELLRVLVGQRPVERRSVHHVV